LTGEDLLFSFPFPVVLTDGEGRIIHANQKFESLVNRSLRYLKGEFFQSFFSPSEEIRKKIKDSYEKLVEIFGFKVENFYFNFSPFYSSSVVEGVVIVVQPANDTPFDKDITLFLKGLSHEIRNPLGGIKGAARLFQKLKIYDEELVDVLIKEAERIERLLDNVVRSFDFSNLNFKSVNIHKILQDVSALFKEKIEKLGVQLVPLFDPSLPEIPLDQDRIMQAFINFFKNSLEALEECGEKKIVIETGYAIHPSGFIFVKFKDTGVGMDEEVLKNFTTPFFTTKERGTGLGTFIACEIVKRHGGEVKVQSRIGEGTEVTVLLPMKR